MVSFSENFAMMRQVLIKSLLFLTTTELHAQATAVISLNPVGSSYDLLLSKPGPSPQVLVNMGKLNGTVDRFYPVIPSTSDITTNDYNDFGPHTPFYSAYSKREVYSNDNQALVTGFMFSDVALTRTTDGKRDFGAASADLGLFVSDMKNNWKANWTSGALPPPGEVDGAWISARQGQRGDTAALIAESSKRRNDLTTLAPGNADGPSENGGAIGAEIGVSLTNATGQSYHEVHTLSAFAESPGGYASGRGHGLYTTIRRGLWYSGLTVQGYQLTTAPAWAPGASYTFSGTSDDANIVGNAGHLYTLVSSGTCTAAAAGAGPATSSESAVVADGGCRWMLADADFTYAMIASHNRDVSSVYFSVDSLSTIRQGLGSSYMQTGFSPATNLWSVANETGAAALVVGKATNVTTAVGGLQIGSGSTLTFRKALMGVGAPLPATANMQMGLIATYTISGAAFGDLVIVNAVSTAPTFRYWRLFGVATAANTIEVYAQNLSGTTYAGSDPIYYDLKVERYNG